MFPLLAVGQAKTVEAELIDFVYDKIPANCGYQIEWGILKFKVIEANANLKQNQIFQVLFQCPRETMESNLGLKNYINHQRYLLTLGNKVTKKEIPKNTTGIYNELKQKSAPIYWLSEIKTQK